MYQKTKIKQLNQKLRLLGDNNETDLWQFNFEYLTLYMRRCRFIKHKIES